jgi:Family of unknown function (DUF6159)
MGRISRSWELVGKSFQVLRSDKELLFFPAMSAFLCICASLGIVAAFAFFYPGQLSAFWAPGYARPVLTQEMWAALFFFYLVNSFVVVFFNVGLVSAASDRLAGGKASVDHGLQVAWSRKWRILEWALVSATFGVLMRILERRLNRIGRIVTGIIGAAWAFATFFVVPLLAAEDIGPMQAMERSAQLIRETWGEEIVGGISLGYVFALLFMPGILIPILLGRAFGLPGVVSGVALSVIYWLLLSAVSSAAHGIFMAALYRYATAKQISGPYRSGDFKMVWQPK